jgi:spermidine/putrescine transport system ATP-binding protein
VGGLEIGGKTMAGIPPHKRPVNTVFQRYALFPHLNVYDNIAFGLRLKKWPGDKVRAQVKASLDLVRLGGFERRNVTQLSGGESQRVALARALINEPSVLLLDEPLGALDLRNRLAMQEELKRIHSDYGHTFLYVTHDQEEAMRMSDRIAVMQAGQIKQVGIPSQIYNDPSCLFCAEFVGESNVFQGKIVKIDGQTVHVEVQGMELKGRVQQQVRMNQSATVVIRPEVIRTHETARGNGPDNTWKGTITRISLVSGAACYQFTADNGLILKTHEHVSSSEQMFPAGKQVCACWPAGKTFVFSDTQSISDVPK